MEKKRKAKIAERGFDPRTSGTSSPSTLPLRHSAFHGPLLKNIRERLFTLIITLQSPCNHCYDYYFLNLLKINKEKRMTVEK